MRLSGFSDWMRLKFRRRKTGDENKETIRKSRSDTREADVSKDIRLPFDDIRFSDCKVTALSSTRYSPCLVFSRR